MSRNKILVVDDSLVVVKTLEIKLKEAGFAVLTAADGSEAIGLARREQPDLIVLDVSFPPDVGVGGGVAWDGFRIMQWLRRQEETMNIPTIIITGQKDETYRDKALKEGATAFLTKPIDHEELVALIRQTIASPAQPVDSPQTAQDKTVAQS